MIFMTTNTIEKLPPPLIRPGRVDVKEYVGLASDQQIRGLFLRFFPDSTSQQASSFTSSLPPNSVSMAQLQGYLMTQRDTIAAALAHVKDISDPAAEKHKS